ncbi:MauE/DoxX family redox-associated membrane protein [Pseudonocardia acaciae]|uniref:MauE/DoxX family redox-associated membrane protein n=1 Tax=Pseudonocardia acaciae TaxID=551276 RepID=UPI0006846A7F|nr:MauE/DoxX family redox-associated membrane protein [Pseudonocardia acaciae]
MNVVKTAPARPVHGWLALLARLILAGVWIAAGLSKITDLNESVRAVRAYRLLPEPAAQVVGAGLPMVELLLGLLLLVGAVVRASAVISAVLMLGFVIGIASAWARGLRIDCGCFGSGGELAAGESPNYGWDLVRDGALFVLALALARWPSGYLAVDGLLAGGRKEERP